MTKELLTKTEALLRDYLRKLECDDYDPMVLEKMQDANRVLNEIKKLQEEM